MYTLDAAYGVATGMGSRWGDADIALLPFNTVFASYRRLYLTLSTVFLADPIHVDFEIFRAAHANNPATVEDVLAALDNNTLDTVSEVPQFEVHTIEYADAYHADYTVEAAQTGAIPSADVPSHLRDEIRMHRNGTDMQRFFDHCMVTVNGYFHPTDTDGTYVYVLKGGQSRIKSQHNQIGIVDFEKIGQVKHYPITEDMIYKQHQDSFRGRMLYFDLKDIDTEGKTVLLVLGGYLYTPAPNVFYPTGNNNYALNLNHVPIIERFFESRQTLDLSSLPLTIPPSTTDLIDTLEFFSDPVITAYATLPQSFFVVVDTPRLVVNRHQIKNSTLPGQFIAYSKPTLPLVVGYGRVPEYWPRFDHGHWAINVENSERPNYLFQSLDQPDTHASGARAPYKPRYHSHGHFLSLSADFPVPPAGP